MAEAKERAHAPTPARKKTGLTDVRVFHDIEKDDGRRFDVPHAEQTSKATVGRFSSMAWRPRPPLPLRLVISDRTPFYAEVGGQLADHEVRFDSQAAASVEVHERRRPDRGLSVHRGTLTEGGMTVGGEGLRRD